MNLREDLFSLKLVQEVEKCPVLYDFNLPDYSKREVVDAAWENVAKVMNESVINCKIKWRNIRTVFSRKLKYPLGIGGKAKVKPYYLMEALQFLSPFMSKHKETIGGNIPSPPGSEEDIKPNLDLNEEVSNDESVNNNIIVEPDVQVIQIPRKRKALKRTWPINASNAALLKYIGRKNKQPREENSRRMFLLSLLPDVQKLSDRKMRVFRKQVLEILDPLLDDEVAGSSDWSPDYAYPRTLHPATWSDGA